MRNRLWLWLTFCCAPALAQTAGDGISSAVALQQAYELSANQTYATASGQELKLDVYARNDGSLRPVLMFIHGGGWVSDTKEHAALAALPFMEMGFNVVNIEYRLGKVAPAPAALEDSVCALQWIGRNAAKYHFDLSKVVLSGESAGGHLALATAMLPPDSPMARRCVYYEGGWGGPWPEQTPKVAAVVNWYGIADVAEMLSGASARSYAVSWFGAMEQREELARRVSPLSMVRAGGVPVFTVHGDADQKVPYSQATRLHQALDKAKVKNQLLTIPGGGHGHFSPEQAQQSYRAIRGFLAEQNLLPATSP